MKKSIKWIAAAALLLLVVFLVWEIASPAVVPVQTAPISNGPLNVSVTDDGVVQHRDVYTVSAPVAGRLLRVELEAGDPVTAHQTVVARLLPAVSTPLDTRTREEQQARLAAANAAVNAAKAELRRTVAMLADARETLKRVEKLHSQALASEQELDRASHNFQARLAEWHAAEALAEVRENERRQAQAALVEPTDTNDAANPSQVLTVAAPVSGVLLKILEKSERTVSAGTPIAEIGDPQNLEVAVDFLSQDAVRMQAGDPVIIEHWGGGQNLQGTVRRVEPYAFEKISALGIEEQRTWVLIDITSPREQWRTLAHGYRVEARVIVEQFDHTPQIPVGALFRHNGQWATFVVDDNQQAHRRQLDIGAISETAAQVIAGIDVGERVIVFPNDQVKEGVYVEATENTMAQ